MSDMNIAQTQIAKTSLSGNAAASGSALKGSGVFSGGAGMAFWDLIIAQIGQSASTKPAIGKETATVPETDASLLTPVAAMDVDTVLLEDDLDLAMAIDESLLALLGEEPAPSDEEKPMSLFDIFTLMQNKNQDPLNKSDTKTELYQELIAKLSAGTPLNAQDTEAVQALVERLTKSSELLRTGKINGEDAPLQLFIALGMSPAQLTQVGEKIARLEEKLGRDITIEDVIAGVGNIINPLRPNETTKPKASIGLASEGVPPSVPAPAPASQASGTSEGRSRYQRAAEQADASLDVKTQTASLTTHTPAPAKIAASVPAFKTLLTAHPVTAAGDVGIPQAWNALFTDNITPGNFDIHTGLPMTQAAQAAHATTAITQAGQPHPATQLVHATLNKMAKGGGPTEMTIQMDPPELGRVLAKLQFGKDKTVKAVLMVEKPETYTMLIRDAASLERALQDAGLTTDSASLSFELAQDGSAFNSDNNGQGGGEPSGRNAAANNNEEVIQTSMTWQVDSETGYVRYNLLA